MKKGNLSYIITGIILYFYYGLIYIDIIPQADLFIMFIAGGLIGIGMTHRKMDQKNYDLLEKYELT